jgi:DNA-binding transcriptional LysR family regulator
VPAEVRPTLPSRDELPHHHETVPNIGGVELRQLRYFVAVAEMLHFGRAARRLHITTPSLSQQIRALERDLGVVLLERSPRRVALTPAGDVLLGHARTLLTQAELARRAVRSTGERPEQLTMRVAPWALAVVGHKLRELSVLVPGVEVSAALCHDSDAMHAVRQERADAAVVWIRSAEDQDLAAITLREVPLRIEPDLVTDGAPLLRAVAAGEGLAPTVPAAAEQLTATGIAVRPLLPPLVVPLELVWREPARPALRQFIAQLEAGTR